MEKTGDFNTTDELAEVPVLNKRQAGLEELQVSVVTRQRDPNVCNYFAVVLSTHTGVMRCIAQPLRKSTTTKRASDPTNTNAP